MKDDIMELVHEYNKQDKQKREDDAKKACGKIQERLKALILKLVMVEIVNKDD